VLLFWHSGFGYDECKLCGVPMFATVSPWWLLLIPFDLNSWPLFVSLLILLIFAGVNAELVDRLAKRPQPQYPTWE
jgi:hypothetical protein